MSPSIKVLVVDDSALMRVKISEILAADRDIEVVGTARDGMDALKKISELKPDVVTLDVEMPKLDGLNTLGYIMSEIPTAVVMVSAYTQRRSEATIRAMEYGAVDFVAKPSGPRSPGIGDVAEELRAKVKIAARVDLSKMRFINLDTAKAIPSPRQAAAAAERGKLVVIGASTGGPRALASLLPELSADIPAGVLVIQHMPAHFTANFAARLNNACRLEVKEAAAGDIIKVGQVLVAPGGYHLMVGYDGSGDNRRVAVSLDLGPRLHGVRPSVDLAMESVAAVYGADSVGVILTGMGSDGTQGMKKIKQNHGRTLAEHKSTCVVYGMPKSAILEEVVDEVVPLNKMAAAIMKVLRK